MIKQTFKTPTQLLCSLIVALMLAACGGGGGSGSGALPQKVTITTSNPTSGTLTEDSVIRIALDETTGFEVSLSGVDITSLFVNDGSNNKKRKVNVYALQGILSENASSKLTASVKGSRVETLNISYKGKPELVFTKIEGSGTGFSAASSTSLSTFTNLKGESDVYGVVIPGSANWPVNTTLPQAAENLTTVDGLVRNALAKSISGLVVTGGGKTFIKGNNNLVSFAEKTETEADFTFTVESTENKTNIVNLAIPGKTIRDEFALQISDMGKEHVISAWVNDALLTYFGTIAPATPEIIKLEGNDVCDGVFVQFMQETLPADYTCSVEVFEVAMHKGEGGFDTTLAFLPLPAAILGQENLEQGWGIKANVASNKPVVAVMHVIAKPTANGAIERVAKLEVRLSKPSVDIDFGLGKFGEQLIALDIDYNKTENTTQSLAVSYGAIEDLQLTKIDQLSCPSGTCPPESAKDLVGFIGDIPESLASFAANQAYCLLPLTINAGIFRDADAAVCGYETVAGVLQVNKPWEKIGDKLEVPVFLDAEATEKTVISAIEQQLKDSRFASSLTQKAGFVSFSGYQKTRDDGVHINALGTHFVSPGQGVEMVAGNLSKVDAADAVVAISSNWINQGLLAAFQSKQLDEEIVSTVGEMGLLVMLGDIPGVLATDPIKINIISTSAPYINFVKDVNNEYIELVINGLNAIIVLQKVIPECTRFEPLGGCKPLSSAGHPFIDVTLDVKARISPNAFVAGADQLLAIDDIMFYITKAVGTKVTVPEGLGMEGFDPTAKNLQAMMYPIIRAELVEALTWEEPKEKTIALCYAEEGGLFNGILQSFIGVKNAEKKLRLQAVSAKLDANQVGKVEHILLGAKLVDGGDSTALAGFALAQLVLKSDGQCPPASPSSGG